MSLCDQLAVLGRDRNYLIQRQFLIERPSEQKFKTELNYALGEHKLTPKQLYEKAAKLRKFLIKHIESWSKLLPSIADVRKCVASVNGKAFSDAELDVMSRLAVFVRIEHDSLETLDVQRKAREKEIAQVAKRLKVADWWCSIRGLNVGGLGKIIAETGDLDNYANPDKVKKRLGLAPFNGKAASTWRKSGGLSKQEWVELGYSPRRRSVTWQIGDSIIKVGGPYREIFDARKLAECEKAVERGLTVVTTTKGTVESWKNAGLPKPKHVKAIGENHITCGHIHARAQRYMEQRIVIDLWAHWTGNVRDGHGNHACRNSSAVADTPEVT